MEQEANKRLQDEVCHSIAALTTSEQPSPKGLNIRREQGSTNGRLDEKLLITEIDTIEF